MSIDLTIRHDTEKRHTRAYRVMVNGTVQPERYSTLLDIPMAAIDRPGTIHIISPTGIRLSLPAASLAASGGAPERRDSF